MIHRGKEHCDRCQEPLVADKCICWTAPMDERWDDCKKWEELFPDKRQDK